MKVAVCAQGPDLSSKVDPRFGRCAYFVIVDSETMDHEALVNPAVDAAHGAGTQAAQVVGNSGATAVLTGNIGPNPMQALGAAGIDVHVGTSGTVKQAIEDFLKGKLAKASGPTVSSHSGLGRGTSEGGARI